MGYGFDNRASPVISPRRATDRLSIRYPAGIRTRCKWRVQNAHASRIGEKHEGFQIDARKQQRQRTATNPDDAIIGTYLKHKNVTGYYEREARAVWAHYKHITDGKALKDASRDDGRKLVDYFDKQNLRSATIQKKAGWLTAAVNLAIDETKLKFNPFSSVVPDRNDKERRLPLSGDAGSSQLVLHALTD
jgi:hypothetical protein